MPDLTRSQPPALPSPPPPLLPQWGRQRPGRDPSAGWTERHSHPASASRGQLLGPCATARTRPAFNTWPVSRFILPSELTAPQDPGARGRESSEPAQKQKHLPAVGKKTAGREKTAGGRPSGVGRRPPPDSLFHRPGAWGRGAHGPARPLPAPGGGAAQRSALSGGAAPHPERPRLGLRARPADPRDSPAPTPASQRRLARARRPSPRQPARRGHGTKATARPALPRAPRGRGGGGGGGARTRTGPGPPRAGTHARTHDARAGPRPQPGSRRPGRRRGRWEAPVGALPGRHVHSPIVKDIPVAGRQPRPSGHFFPLPALRERRALPPLPLHRARLLGPPPPPPGPPLAAAASAASVAAAATCRGCSGPRAPALRPQPGTRRLCRPLGPLPALASPRSGGPLRPPARARGPVLRRRRAGPSLWAPAPPRGGGPNQRAARGRG